MGGEGCGKSNAFSGKGGGGKAIKGGIGSGGLARGSGSRGAPESKVLRPREQFFP